MAPAWGRFLVKVCATDRSATPCRSFLRQSGPRVSPWLEPESLRGDALSRAWSATPKCVLCTPTPPTAFGRIAQKIYAEQRVTASMAQIPPPPHGLLQGALGGMSRVIQVHTIFTG